MRKILILAVTTLSLPPMTCFAFDATITGASPVAAVPTGKVSTTTLAPIDAAAPGNTPPPQPYVYEQVRAKSVGSPARLGTIPVPIPRPEPVLGCVIQW